MISDYLKDPSADQEFPNVYRFIVENADAKKIIIMASATNEEHAGITDTSPDCYQFEPSDKLPDAMMDKFIPFILGGIYDINENTIAKIREITGDNLQWISLLTTLRNKRRDLFESQSDIESVQSLLIEAPHWQITVFLREEQTEYESRLTNMTKSLTSL